jgi:hypothetical protein
VGVVVIAGVLFYNARTAHQNAPQIDAQTSEPTPQPTMNAVDASKLLEKQCRDWAQDNRDDHAEFSTTPDGSLALCYVPSVIARDGFAGGHQFHVTKAGGTEPPSVLGIPNAEKILGNFPWVSAADATALVAALRTLPKLDPDSPVALARTKDDCASYATERPSRFSSDTASEVALCVTFSNGSYQYSLIEPGYAFRHRWHYGDPLPSMLVENYRPAMTTALAKKLIDGLQPLPAK